MASELVDAIPGSDIALFWLDDHIGQAGTCNKLKEEFESNTTSIRLFYDVQECARFVKCAKNKKLFCIVQGKHAKTIVPLIQENAIPSMVYIFCFNINALNEWAQDFECIMSGGIFDHEADLLAKLTTDLVDYAKSKVAEYCIKRKACEDWAENLTKSAKRMHNEQCTLPFRTDPFSDIETDGVQPQ